MAMFSRLQRSVRSTYIQSMSFFPDIPKLQYEGPKSKNPFAFKQYNPDEIVAGKSMKDHTRFAAAYWHVMRNGLSDPFGGAHGPDAVG